MNLKTLQTLCPVLHTMAFGIFAAVAAGVCAWGTPNWFSPHVGKLAIVWVMVATYATLQQCRLANLERE